MQPKKILFVYTHYSTFVEIDFELLSSKYSIKKYHFIAKKGLINTVLAFIKQFFYLLFNIWKYDAVFVWFADYHSFLPIMFAKIWGRKSFVVIGGYDVANMPELKYGSLSSPLRKSLTLFTFKYATACLPVVDELEKKLKIACPSAKTKTIYTGYNFKVEKQPDFETDRAKIILTVSITQNQQRMLIKGLDRFEELAKKMSDYKFIVVGINQNAQHLFEPVPENLVLLPPLKQTELTDYYSKASFYAQFSRSEGLPNTLCDAMLYGCIPLGMNIGGIPTAMGNLGFLTNEWNVQNVENYVRENHNKTNRETFGLRIKDKFDLDFRKEKLLNLIR